MRRLLFVFFAVMIVSSMFAKDNIIIAWYPNESGEELKVVREEIGKIIEKATGKKVEHRTTTDYLIAIEAIANGNAHLAFTGGEGYVQANKKNNKVLPLVTNSGESGTLNDAVYFSWLNVKKGNESKYMTNGKYSLDNIAGKKFSFVSSSSTSGFKVPSANIVSYFSKMDKYKKLVKEDLLESGSFFSEVLFGGSHQGAAVNLLTDKADVASFCDVCVSNYVEFVSGTPNKPGAVYKVRDKADEPFDKIPGYEFVVISVTPVLNSPFIYNSKLVDKKDYEAMLKALTSEETTNNEIIFYDKSKGGKGLWKKGEKFLKVDDTWYNPIRELGQN